MRVTNARDFLGTQLTYDSHNGTDFAVPLGTVVVAAAPGVVRRVSSEFNRGGLKVFIDHGAGLVTSSNHLGRSMVAVGDRVARGQPIALSAYSGLDGPQHLPLRRAPRALQRLARRREYVDPFAAPGETPSWRAGNWPVPSRDAGAALPASDWDHPAIERAIEAAWAPELRAGLRALSDPDERAVAVLFQQNYYPTRFRELPRLYGAEHPGPRGSTCRFARRTSTGSGFPRRRAAPAVTPSASRVASTPCPPLL
ncbi:MAG: M23 family metallopeptidase [Deltaproteobacteria bacterium]|nr:M23 family metallopeptidase [Deltaproteobacteria bacterium]